MNQEEFYKKLLSLGFKKDKFDSNSGDPNTDLDSSYVSYQLVDIKVKDYGFSVIVDDIESDIFDQENMYDYIYKHTLLLVRKQRMKTILNGRL